jgi:hypothetical protein
MFVCNYCHQYCSVFTHGLLGCHIAIKKSLCIWKVKLKCFHLQSVASIGSTLTSVQHDVKTIQTALEDQKKETDDLKKTMVKNIKILASFTLCSFQLEPMPAFSLSEPASGTNVQMHELRN